MAQNRIEGKVFQIKKESARLTAEIDPTAATRTLAVLGASEVQPVPTLIEDTKLRGDGLEREAANGIREFSGVLEQEVAADNMGELLLGLFGDVTTDQPDFGNAPTVFRHRFSKLASSGQNPTHTLFIDRVAHQKRYGGVTPSQMTVNYPVDNRLASSTDIMAVVEEDHGTPLVPLTSALLNDLLFSGVAVEVAGVSNSQVRTASVVMLNNLAVKRALTGSRDPQDLCAGVLQVSGSFSLYFENDTERDKFVASAVSALKLTTTGQVLEDVQVATFELDCPRIKYSAGPISEQDGILIQDFTFNAYFDSIAGYSVRPELISQVVSY